MNSCNAPHTRTTPTKNLQGLPPVTASWWLPLHDAGRLAPLAAVVMLVDLLESTSIARMLAAKAGYELSANQVVFDYSVFHRVCLCVCV